jgi:hypothetical protein
MDDQKRTDCHPRRRTKADRKELLQALFENDDDAVELWSNMVGDGAIEDFVITSLDIDAKFRELDDRLRPRVETARQQALTDPSQAGALRTPWVTKQSPEAKLVELRRKLFLNERVIGTLMDHLAVHLALSTKLEQLIRLAEEYKNHRDRQVPATIERLMIGMYQAGLKAEFAQDLPAWRIERLVDYTNDQKGPGGRAALEALLAGNKPDIEAEFRAFDATREREEGEKQPAVSTGITDAPTPVVPVGFESEWTVEKEPVPPKFWSQFQTSARTIAGNIRRLAARTRRRSRACLCPPRTPTSGFVPTVTTCRSCRLSQPVFRPSGSWSRCS